MKIRLGKWQHITVLSLLGILFIFVVSRSLLPMFFGPTGDTAVFLTLGKYCAQGYLPYVDIWELKGPIIFFINALGYWLTGSEIGVFIIELITICITLMLIYWLFQKQFSLNASFWFTLATFVVLMSVFATDSVEEHTLPLLFGCFIGFWQWSSTLQEKQFEHDYRFAFLYGIFVCFCLFTRATDAVGVCGGVAVISITLCCKKRWKNLLQNALGFLVGFFLLFVPIFIYFAANHALYDMWYGTILYNLGYMARSVESAANTSLKEIFTTVTGFFGCIGLPIVGIFVAIYNKKRRAAGILWIVVGVLTGAWLFNSFRFLHYGAIALPYFCISIMELHRLGMEKPAMKKISRALTICIVAIGFIAGANGAISILKGIYYEFVILPAHENEEPLIIEERFAREVIPEDEMNSFIAWNCSSGLYLKLDQKPYYPQTGDQGFIGDCNESMKMKIHDTFAQGDVQWILVRNAASQIQDVLNERYDCVRTLEVPEISYHYEIWKLK